MKDIIDFAYQIIELHEENQALRAEVDHLTEMRDIHLEHLNETRKSQDKFVGTMLLAIVDPESELNKTHAMAINAQALGLDNSVKKTQ